MKGTEHRGRKCKETIKIRRPPGKLQQMVRSNRNFHKNCTKNKNKKPKERY